MFFRSFLAICRPLLEEFELRRYFPKGAKTSAGIWKAGACSSEIETGTLRPLTCFTIDPDTAKDFDDAISFTKDARWGHYNLGVHVADVSLTSVPVALLDEEAASGATPPTFQDFAFPCSLHALSRKPVQP